MMDTTSAVNLRWRHTKEVRSRHIALKVAKTKDKEKKS